MLQGSHSIILLTKALLGFAWFFNISNKFSKKNLVLIDSFLYSVLNLIYKSKRLSNSLSNIGSITHFLL